MAEGGEEGFGPVAEGVSRRPRVRTRGEEGLGGWLRVKRSKSILTPLP